MRADIRKYFLFVVSIGAAAATLWGGTILATETPKKTGGIMAPGPEAGSAIQAEYDGVVREGTREAYERFIRRHAKHALAQTAREDLERGDLK